MMLAAMSGDGKGRTRRPRPVGRPVVPPGPLADLKDLLYELYRAAGTPTLDEIAAWIREDDLAGAPGRDTIARVIGDAGVPASQADVVAVAAVLARAARWDPRDAAGRVRALWVAARMARPAGVPLEEVTDPLALEVHRPVESDGMPTGLPLLPPYVGREHDARLAGLAAQAAEGRSVMAALVAGSSAGKTRACWEALGPLRQAGGWRLWHPRDPSRTEAALRELPQVGPRTVVWLNEAQEYLGGADGERVAAGLRTLLADPARAPVLVLGTLWPGHYDALTRNPGSQVRQLLDGTVIEVPAAFSGTALAALRQAAGADPRLAQAAKRAEDGEVTQYLAGGPALLERLAAAPPAAKAMICAAMDARRLGMGDELPLALLQDAAPGYLTGTEQDALGEDWAEQALAYAAVPCKGARGPLTRIRPRSRSGRGPSARPGDPVAGPAYRLADYLDQHGRARRARQLPPPEFWTAAAAHATPIGQATLGDAAHNRGLYRDAAQLCKNATAHGSTKAACDLVARLHALHPSDPRPSHWAAAHADFTDLYGVTRLLDILQKAGASDQFTVLANRAAAHADLTDPRAVAFLLDSLLEAGADDQATALLARDPATHADSTAPDGVAFLLDLLLEAGADDQATALLARDPATHADLTAPDGVARLLNSLLEAGADDQATALLARDPATHADLRTPDSVATLLISLQKAGAGDQATALANRATADGDPSVMATLLHRLREAGAGDQFTVLANRAATHARLTHPFDVARMLNSLREAGASDQFTVLANRAATHASLTDPGAVAFLLDSLRKAGADDQAAALLARDPAAHADLSTSDSVARLLDGLREAGADDQFTVLANRAATHAPLGNAARMAHLLDSLREAGADDQFTVLANRAVTHVDFSNPGGLARLLNSLRKAGADDLFTVLANRAATHARLNELYGVASLLDSLREAGADDLFTVLANRAATHVDFSNPGGEEFLLDSLRKVGADGQFTTLGARLPAAGLFRLFLDQCETGGRYRFGQEADSSPAAPWGWDDLS